MSSMAETVSPTNRPRPRPTARLHLQSPTSPTFPLGSNNDDLERAQARAARVAAVRRKIAAAAAASQSAVPPGTPCLDKEQILDLFHNCIKLASENKINQKNTWDLSLIDHLHDIIKVEEENHEETNFQKASCTLEAGVKIYSMRVDSVHSEAYKVLGGFNRVGQEDENDNATDADANIGQDEGMSKKDRERKVSPMSTLESSFEALNVKKFDAAFAVDPLYHQTSAQFDEGGAKGLLLNNLGVYGGCRVLFDSFEIPGRSMSCVNHEKSETIDLSFAKEYIDQMVFNMNKKVEISPTLKDIVNLFDESSRRPSNPFPCAQTLEDQIHEEHTSYDVELDGNVFEDCGNWGFDHDDQASVIGEETYNNGDPPFHSHQEEYEMTGLHDPEMNDEADNVDEYLFLSLGFKSKQNAWAGPDHWKYQKAKGTNETTKENGSPPKTSRARNKKQAEADIDFTKALEKDEIVDVFAPPKNPNSLLLPANRTPCNTTLPEDCHYQPEDLVKLFLLPNVMCLGRRRRKPSAKWSEQKDDYGPLPSWEDDNMFDGQYDQGDAYSDVEDSNTLVSQPRQVNKIEVQYDKTSKQVDVQTLKETLWNHLQESSQMSVQEEKEGTSFKHMLANFPEECNAASALNDISPHLCFICLLHLANEHNLSIHGCTNLDDLTIRLPPDSNPSPTATKG